MIKTIDREELRTLLGAEGVVVGEVLPRAQYDAGHLPGAIHLPLERVLGAQSVAELASPTGHAARTVILYCSGPTCSNSEQAAARLAHVGHEDVRVYRGGKADWRQAGLPLDGGTR